jgi:hypothetical protein
MADQLVPIPLVTPGFKGLNKTQASVPDLDPGWAIECQNFIFDQSGRLASRQGWASLTASPLAGTPAIGSMAELALANGTTFVVSAANNKLYSGTTTLTDITGALTITGNAWQWVTFNGKIYGVQAGHPLISWDGVAASFVVNPVTAGTAPTGGTCILAAFGRLWVLNADNQTILYCALLDSTTWNGVSAGSLNMATVWTRGIDQVIGLGAAGSKLVIFGTKQIVIYADSAGSVLGLNPVNMYVYDTVEGTGLAARDTLQSTGEGDLTFLSPTGVQSLQRLLSSGKDNPVASLDPQIRDYFNGYFVNEVASNVRSAYSPANRFYVILLPVAGRAFCYDTRHRLQDGSMRVTEWPAVTWTALVNRKNGDVLVGEKGIVGQYSGYLDNNIAYTVVYNSPNLALSGQGDANFENKQKILKRIKAVLYYSGNSTVTFTWGVDFKGLLASQQIALMGALSEFGIAQYNINEFGGGAGLQIVGFPLTNSGRWLQFGFTAPISGSQIAIQQIDAFVKIGVTV